MPLHYSKISDLDFGGIYVEAPCLTYSIKYNKWYLYADAYNTLGDYYYMTTSDFSTWSSASPVSSTEGLRHGTVLNLSTLPHGQQAIASYERGVALLGQMMPQSPLTSPRGQFSTSATTSIKPVTGMVYRTLSAANMRIYIDEIGTTDHFYLACTSDLPGSGITISGAYLQGGFIT